MLTPLATIAGLFLAMGPTWAGGVISSLPPFERSAERPAPMRLDRDVPASLLTLSDDELARVVETDSRSLGSLSIGRPGSAVVVNGVPLEQDPRWTIASGAVTWGTTETMDAIRTVIDTVWELFPDTPPLIVGDISHEEGGRLKRHESHQAGRDVDLGFYFTSGPATRMVAGTAANLDLPRNWALVRALLVRTDVDVVFLDRRIQKLLYKYALSISEDQEWLDHVFGFAKGSRNAIVQHLPSHRNHYHVRFYNPVAQELGRRVHPLLVQMGLMKPPVYTVRHVARRGQTLGHLAARYGTTARAIQQANGLRTTRLRAGRSYRIPVRASATSSGEPIVIPPRLLPPATPDALSNVEWATSHN